jgi:hypothetical protein
MESESCLSLVSIKRMAEFSGREIDVLSNCMMHGGLTLDGK